MAPPEARRRRMKEKRKGILRVKKWMRSRRRNLQRRLQRKRGENQGEEMTVGVQVEVIVAKKGEEIEEIGVKRGGVETIVDLEVEAADVDGDNIYTFYLRLIISPVIRMYYIGYGYEHHSLVMYLQSPVSRGMVKIRCFYIDCY
mmetsp:Transcript_9520/g.14294  ORF Transcript_9520/g.14294 Transcript_9520/m.14294 type:complete len:144 (+) Transcript_9520:716-1147(+)